MFKIGEFSKLVHISSRMLRYYDKCGLIKPAQIDPFTGYRLYSAEQIPILYEIIKLRDMGFLVEEIETILPCFEDEEYMQKALDKKRQEIISNIISEKAKLEKIAIMSKKIEKGHIYMIYDVELKTLPAVKVLSLREIIPAYDGEFALWNKMGKFIYEENIACEKCGYSIYYDDEYKESDVDVEIAVPVLSFKENKDGFIYKELEEIPLAAAVRFSGPYENYSKAMEKVALWIEKNGYEISGLVRGLAIQSPSDESNPENYLTELQISVKKII